MTADFGPVKVGFQVDQVGNAVAAVQGIINNISHKTGVEACLLERPFQALALRAVAV
jgi:hypothetical protein